MSYRLVAIKRCTDCPYKMTQRGQRVCVHPSSLNGNGRSQLMIRRALVAGRVSDDCPLVEIQGNEKHRCSYCGNHEDVPGELVVMAKEHGAISSVTCSHCGASRNLCLMQEDQ